MAKKRTFASRLSRKIILGTSLIFVLSLVVMSVASIRISNNASVKYATELLHATISEIESPIIQTERITDGIARSIEEYNHAGAKLDTSNFYDLLESSIARNPYLLGLGVYYEPYAYDKKSSIAAIYVNQDSETGEIVKEWGDDQDESYVEWDYPSLGWYKTPKEEGEPMWLPPFFEAMDSGDSLLMTTYSFPIKDKAGKIFAICSTDLQLEWLKEKLESLKPYPKSNIIIADQDLNYICNPMSDTPFQGSLRDTPFIYGMSKTFKDEPVQWIMDEMNEKGSVTIKSDNRYAFCVLGYMSNGWIVSINTLYSDAFRDIFLLILILVGLVVLGLLILYLTSRRTITHESKPLVKFAGAASQITDGKFDIPIPEVNTEDEIEDLGNALRYMQVSVTEYISQLKTMTAEKERLASELNISRQIQAEMLLKDFPKMEKGGLFASCTPAREVGGDLYDFVTTDKEIFFILGDVSGKGVPAALLMAITIAAFRSISKKKHTMDDMVGLINKTFCKSSNELMFVTLVVGRIDRETGEMIFCNAGHNPMILISPDGKAEYIKANSNIACGVIDEFVYTSDSLRLFPGSRLLVYTDGVTEAERADKAQYGEDRLLEFASSASAELSDSEFIESLIKSVKAFTEGNEPNDDLTVMSISI